LSVPRWKETDKRLTFSISLRNHVSLAQNAFLSTTLL